MRLYVDDYFHIGSAHLTGGKPCQDYATSGVFGDIALAIISDGCSTGGHTDIGSRIIALSTSVAIREHWAVNRSALGEGIPKEISLRQKITLSGVSQALGLKINDMLATCVYAYITPAGGFVHIQGDGVVALKYQNDDITMSRFEWNDNIPFYPVYNYDNYSGFIEAHDNDLTALRLSEEVVSKKADDTTITSSDLKHFTLSQGINGITIRVEESLLNELSSIAVFSDGVTQIDKIDWKEAVIRFMSFKNTTGAFAKRRMIKGIKDTQACGRGPLDDISYAVIRIEQNETAGGEK